MSGFTNSYEYSDLVGIKCSYNGLVLALWLDISEYYEMSSTLLYINYDICSGELELLFIFIVFCVSRSPSVF